MNLNRAVDCNKHQAPDNELALDLFESDCPTRRNVDRHDVEKFIHKVFVQAYEADLYTFYRA